MSVRKPYLHLNIKVKQQVIGGANASPLALLLDWYYLINERDPEGAIEYTKECLNKMIEGGYNIKYFIK